MNDEYHATLMMFDPTISDDGGSWNAAPEEESREFEPRDGESTGDASETRAQPSNTEFGKMSELVSVDITDDDGSRTIFIDDLDLLEWYKITRHTDTTSYSTDTSDQEDDDDADDQFYDEDEGRSNEIDETAEEDKPNKTIPHVACRCLQCLSIRKFERNSTV